VNVGISIHNEFVNELMLFQYMSDHHVGQVSSVPKGNYLLPPGRPTTNAGVNQPNLRSNVS